MVEANVQNNNNNNIQQTSCGPMQGQPSAEEMNSPQDMHFATPGQNEQSNMDMTADSSGAASITGPPMLSLKMKGLPFTVTREEILTFFQGSNLIEDSVKVGVYPDGRLTGEACVLFSSDDDCQAAHAKLDQKYIGTRWVKLIRVVMEEYTNFDSDQQNRYSDRGNNDYGARRGGGNFSRGGGDFDSGFQRGGRGRGRGGRGRGRGGFNNDFDGDRGDRGGYQGGDRGGYQSGDRGGYQGGDKEDRGERSDRGDRGGRGDRGDRGSRGGRGGDRGGDRGGRFGGGGGNTVRLSDFVNAENQYTTLKMRGLPFSVSEREIRDFFQDFRVAERDIKIDMNQGRPTGYALVFFENDDEASRARDQLNKKYLGSRYVDLSYPDLR